MRILYVIIGAGLLSTAALWLGQMGALRRRTAALAAVLLLAAGGGLLLQAVLPENSFYGPVLYKVNTDKKLIALTFDDGPYPPYTGRLLEVLREKNVHATFFVVGENAARHPELVKQAAAEGHEVALHAGTHRDLLKLNGRETAENIAAGTKTLTEITGQEPRFMRPPHGFKDWRVMREIERAGLTAVNWSVIPRDWTNPGTEVIVQRVCEKAFPGAIVLLHDGDSPKNAASREQTVQAAGKIIDRLRGEGYEFVTVGRLQQAATEK